MCLFLLGLALLVVGYFFYGRLVERIVGMDDSRPTPAVTHADGVDFVELPHWKNMLIQLLNIAGVGPVIGVILGIKFGSIVFLIIPIGNILGGAVHDFVSGVMSLRNRGANLPALIRMTLGGKFYRFFAVFMVFLLLLVVAVFVNIPAKLIDGLVPSLAIFHWAVAAIFLYYIVATIFPVDQIIGRIYPFFGLILLIGTFAIFGMLVWQGFEHPALLSESAEFKAQMETQSIIPALFVTIACGILSGFHATQSPIIARTMPRESHARPAFYGMMVLEGAVGMVWAAGGLAIFNLFPELMKQDAAVALSKITTYFLGNWMGALTVLGVIVLAVTSGDTAMRSLRLSLAEMMSIDQKPLKNRITLCLPLILIVSGLLWWSNISANTFNQLWRYFAWGNQVLAACTLMGCTVWLMEQRKTPWITLLPGVFMTFIVVSYILWISPANVKGAPIGFGFPLYAAYVFAALGALVLGVWVYRRGRRAGSKQS